MSVIAPRGHPHELLVEVDAEGYCVGTQREPTVGDSEVDEPAPSQVVVRIPVRHYPQHGDGCAGVGTGFQVTVHTEASTAGLSVYDGSDSPPKRIGVHHWDMSEHSRRLRELRWAKESAQRYRRERAHMRAVQKGDG